MHTLASCALTLVRFQVIEEKKPEAAAAGEKEPELASGAKAEATEAEFAESAKEEEGAADVDSESAGLFGLDGSMAQWLKRLAGGIGRSKADDAEAAQKYQVRCSLLILV